MNDLLRFIAPRVCAWSALASLAMLLPGCIHCGPDPSEIIDDTPGDRDLDRDGYTPNQGDCDDEDAQVHPGAEEACNGLDDDCDGQVPDDEQDHDGDGFRGCDGDCDDHDDAIRPGAEEVCNGVDDDCDGTKPKDEADCDGDGFAECGEPGDDLQGLIGGGDCDDADPDTHPYAVDPSCDGIDQDCDGVDPTDGDGDGYDCTEDCDDTLDEISPGAQEVPCNGLDEDCDGDDACGPLGTIPLDAADAAFVGEAESDYSGVRVCSAGDVDGDGYGDFLIGAHWNDEGAEDAGKAYLVFGPSTGEHDLADADVSLVGDEPYDHLGYALAAAGDTDGDGRDDVLVGAPARVTSAAGPGRALLFRAPSAGTLTPADADAVLGGEFEDDHAGISVSGGGYIDGDGEFDLLVGASGNDAAADNAGKTYVVYGPVDGDVALASADALVGVAEDEAAGTCVVGAVDLDVDGYDDIVVGAPGALDDDGLAVGKVYLVFDPPSGDVDLASAGAVLVGEGAGHWAGYSVAVADFDGDWLLDVAVGAPHHDGLGPYTGAVYVVYGPVFGTVELETADVILSAAGPGDRAGFGLASAGDVNGDDHDDLFVGAWGHDGTDGAAFLLYGELPAAADLSIADAVFIAEAAEDAVGYSVAGAGDVDGDGFDDLLVGAVFNDQGGDMAGKSYLIYADP